MSFKGFKKPPRREEQPPAPSSTAGPPPVPSDDDADEAEAPDPAVDRPRPRSLWMGPLERIRANKR
ncbi:hypothetical protein EPO34_01100 [Patescibacteria group bacterium]|nr:MAG: hypothetical protein EPO34_01100 [Patescibacteria group bacterium]